MKARKTILLFLCLCLISLVFILSLSGLYEENWRNRDAANLVVLSTIVTYLLLPISAFALYFVCLWQFKIFGSRSTFFRTFSVFSISLILTAVALEVALVIAFDRHGT